MSQLIISQLEKRYGSQTVVDRISFELSSGSFLSLVGPSGCGKTTILRMIAGLIDVDGGKIQIGERDVTRLPPDQRNLGLVFQSYALFPHMTVFENVAFGLRRRKVSNADVSKRVTAALDLVRLGHLANRKPKQMSGGQQQRIALARALVIEPSLLLLDEPLSNLDALLRGEMCFEIKRLQQQFGITTVFVTHDQTEALAMADHVALLNRGKIEQWGTPENLYQNPINAFAASFIGHANQMTVAGLSKGSNGLSECSIAGNDGRIVIFAADASAVQAGRPTIAVVRHEAIEISTSGGEADNIVSGRILVSSFEGATTQYLIRTDTGIEIQAKAATPAQAYKVGQPVFARWSARDTVLLPGDPV